MKRIIRIDVLLCLALLAGVLVFTSCDTDGPPQAMVVSTGTAEATETEVVSDHTDTVEVTEPQETTTEESAETDSEATSIDDVDTTVEPMDTTAAQTDAVTEPEIVSPGGEANSRVWISASGKKYHSKPICSGMKSPEEISLKSALERKYEPCKKCH